MYCPKCFKCVKCVLKNIQERYFPGSVVETSPSSAGGVGSIPGEGTKVLHALFYLKYLPF